MIWRTDRNQRYQNERSIMKNLSGLLAFALPGISEFEATRSRMKQNIKELEKEYWDTCKLPRKKKKQRRKHILALYALLKDGEKLFDKYSLEGLLF